MEKWSNSLVLLLLRLVKIAELVQKLVIGPPELQLVEPVPRRFGQLYRRLSLGH